MSISISPQESFHAFLDAQGYTIEKDNPIFARLFSQWCDGTLYQAWWEEFGPVLQWNAKAKVLLVPYRRIALCP